VRVAIVSLGLLVAVGSSIRVEDETIKVSDLPKAVTAALKAKYPKGELTKAVKEEEDGKTVYEVVVANEGEKLEVAVSASGKLLEVEQAIAAEKLPSAVTTAIKAKYPEAKIKKAEQIVKFEGDSGQEREKSFEVVLAAEGKADFEVEVSAAGKIIEDAEDDKPDKKKEKD
jgi:hypothetical protein